MNKRVKSILELDKILLKLSEYAVMNNTKEYLMNMEVSSNVSVCRRMLEETDEARIFTVKHSKVPIAALSDITAAVKRLKIGATLGMGELLSLAHILRGAAGNTIQNIGGNRHD